MGCHFPNSKQNHTSLPHMPAETKTGQTPTTMTYQTQLVQQIGATSQMQSSIVYPVSTGYQANSGYTNQNSNYQYIQAQQIEIKSVDAKPPLYSPTPFQSVANLQYSRNQKQDIIVKQTIQKHSFNVPCGPSTQDFYLTPSIKF